MKLKVNDRVTIVKAAREAVILEHQYHADIVRETDRGYYVTTGDALDVDDQGQVQRDGSGRVQLREFGPFRADQLVAGWVEL